MHNYLLPMSMKKKRGQKGRVLFTNAVLVVVLLYSFFLINSFKERKEEKQVLWTFGLVGIFFIPSSEVVNRAPFSFSKSIKKKVKKELGFFPPVVIVNIDNFRCF